MNTLYFFEREMTEAEFARMNAGFDEHTLEHGNPLESSERYGFVVLGGDKFIGCASGLAFKNGYVYNGWFYLTDLFVEKDYRRQGLGTALLGKLEARVTALGITNIWTFTAGFEAPEFYKKQGYKIIFEQENWYATGHNRIALHKTLSLPPIIRDAQQSDIAALSELAQQTYSEAFGHTFCESDLAAHLQKHLAPACFSRILEDDVVLLAEVGNRLIGYVQFGRVNPSFSQENDQELRRLYVHPEFQNQGVGSALMEEALRHPQMSGAAAIYLDVWEHNHGAQRFYRRYGFEVIGTRAFEVESGAETSLDLLMARRVASEQNDSDPVE